MSYQDWKKQAGQTHKGQGFEPQKPGESKDTFNDRVAGNEWANKNK